MKISFEIIILMTIGILIGGIWQFIKTKNGHDLFYFSFSNQVVLMSDRVVKVVNGKDEQRLIYILLETFKEMFLSFLKSPIFKQGKIKPYHYKRYELIFYTTLAAIKIEWFVNKVDRSLVYLFLEKNRDNFLRHLNNVEHIFAEKVRIQTKRKELAKEFFSFLKNTGEQYILAFDEYKKTLKGETSTIEILERLNIKKTEMEVLTNAFNDNNNNNYNNDIKSNSENEKDEFSFNFNYEKCSPECEFYEECPKLRKKK